MADRRHLPHSLTGSFPRPVAGDVNRASRRRDGFSPQGRSPVHPTTFGAPWAVVFASARRSDVVGGTLLFGDGHAEPLLGVTVLESDGFEVAPRTQQLKGLPAVLLQRLTKAVDSA